MNEEFYSIGRGSLNINGKFYYGLDYEITDFMRSLEEENKQLKEQLQQKEDIINKAIKKCNKEKERTDFDIFINLNEQLKTLEGFAKKIDYNLHPIITEAYKCDIRNSIDDLCKTLRYDVVYKDSIKEILDNKGDENDG